MKKIFRSISEVVLAVAVMLTAVVFDVPEKITAEAALSETASGGCDGTHSGMTEWTDTTSLPAESGSYYLNYDVTLANRAYFNDGDITLCLNGHTVNAQTFTYCIQGPGTLTLCDCQSNGKLTGGGNNYYCGAVWVDGGATFTMNGGTISGNTSTSDCGAVYMTAQTKFIMNGGTISGNTATSDGGAVGVRGNNASFIMNGGTISGNTATSNGGAVSISGKNASFTMNGGTISGNKANDGGGVYINNSTASFTMNGGTISGNTANSGGGVSLADGKITIAGNVNISGNKKGAVADNVYLPTGKTITVNSLNAASKIGVNTATTPANCKNYVNVTGTTIKDISDCFTADIDGQIVVYDSRMVRLSVAHDWGEWETTAATCTAEGKKERFCITSGCTEKETQTIDKIDHVYENGKCKNCSAIDPNHTHTGGTATCEKKAVCDICEQEYGELGEHIYGAWSITKYPSTTATGTAERACSCGEKQTKTDVPVLTDTSVWTKDDTQHVDPTEDGAGKDVYTSVYGTVTVTIPQLGHTHTLTHVDEIPATETTEGVKEHWYCSSCKKDFTDENGTTEISDLTIPVIGHTHTLTHISATETTKEHWHCDCGKDFLDENGEHEATADDLKTGMIEKEVQSGDNAPAATLTTPADELINAVLTEEDKELVNEGKDIKIILTIDDAANKVSNADKAAVEAAIGNESGFILGQCLDVNLLKIIDGRQEKIAQTSTPLTITFEIPVGLRGSGRTFSVIRVHDGETTILEDKDENADTVTIETDKFSTYALAYSENTNVTPPGGGSSGGNAPAPSVSKPTNSGDTSSESRGSSDNGNVTSSSGETSSTDENNFMPSESMPTDNNENPATGITMSLVPLAAAVIVLTVTIKRKRNK